MFKKLKKDRNRILFIFFIEAFIATAAIITIIILKKNDFVQNYALYILLAYFLLINIFNIALISKLLKVSERFLVRSDITIASIFGNEVSPIFEFGNVCIFVYNEEDEVIWLSQTTLLKKDDILGQKIYDLIPNFDELALKESKEDIFVQIAGKTFQLNINTGLKVVYLKDVSAQVIQQAQAEAERPFIGHIVIDNYQDIITSLGETDFVLFVSEVKEVIMNWAKKYNLFIRSYGNDSFLIIGEEMNYLNMKKDHFSILEEIRRIAEKDDNPLTISIGIGKGHTSSILRTSELAYMALNMALTRGGDQIVVNQFGSPLQYFGAKNEVKQTRSHVRGRVLATSLSNLIKNSKDVYIMGHKNMDFDALGASMGVYAICKSLKANAHFLYEDSSIDVQTKRSFKQIFTSEEIAKMSVTPSKALSMVSEQSLVIVVDTHRPASTLQPGLLEKCKDVCVIDHHRRSDVFIVDPIFQYHEPSSSSASELVTELMYYQPNKVDVMDRIANFLLAGICLDTKFFKSSTSGKTFEMAMILKNYGANVDEVNEYFKEEYEEMKLLNSIINNSYSPSTGIIIANSDEGDIVTRSVLAKAAEEILNIKDIKAVFVVGQTTESEISVSARSLNDFNVQIIMESMGGGGHFSKAAVQLYGTTIHAVKDIVEEKISVFLRDGRV